MRRALLVFAVLALAAEAAAANPVTMRPATPRDDVSRGAVAFTEWWTVAAFHPTNGDYVIVRLFDRPTPLLEVRLRSGGQLRGAQYVDLDVMPHRGPGVTLARTPDDAPPEPVSLSYRGGRYLVDLAYPLAKGRIVVTPRLAGLTVGPWLLGPEPVYTTSPGTKVTGTRHWSVPVATGSASGWIELEYLRVALRGWRAYHDHTWGRFRFETPSWYHADFAVVTPRVGETVILNGLEIGGEGPYRWLGDDRRWRGVLLRVGRGGVSACRATVRRTGWQVVWDRGDPYRYPLRVSAGCGGISLVFERPPPLWQWYPIMHAARGDGPLPGRVGWAEHTTAAAP